VGNSHLGETDEQRTAAVKAVRQVCETNVPTLIQGADSLHQVSVACAIKRNRLRRLSHVQTAPYKCRAINSASTNSVRLRRL
jgi:hypothetical protein